MRRPPLSEDDRKIIARCHRFNLMFYGALVLAAILLAPHAARNGTTVAARMSTSGHAQAAVIKR
ncbi:MAG TPA: hypothetical protein VGH49_15740 [Xanthobacteraceae bacterium]